MSSKNDTKKIEERVKMLTTTAIRLTNHYGLKAVLDEYRKYCVNVKKQERDELYQKDKALASELQELEAKFQAQVKELQDKDVIATCSRNKLNSANPRIDSVTSVTLEQNSAVPVVLSDVNGLSNSLLERSYQAMEHDLEKLDTERKALRSNFNSYKKEATTALKLLHPIRYIREIEKFEALIKANEVQISELRQKMANNRHTIALLKGLPKEQTKQILSLLKLGNLTHAKGVERNNTRHQISVIDQGIEDIKDPSVHDEQLITRPSFEDFVKNIDRRTSDDLNLDFNLVQFAQYARDKHIGIRYNDGSLGFPIQDYVHMGRYQVELLELLKYIDKEYEQKRSHTDSKQTEEVVKDPLEETKAKNTELQRYFRELLRREKEREKAEKAKAEKNDEDQPNS